MLTNVSMSIQSFERKQDFFYIFAHWNIFKCSFKYCFLIFFRTVNESKFIHRLNRMCKNVLSRYTFNFCKALNGNLISHFAITVYLNFTRILLVEIVVHNNFDNKWFQLRVWEEKKWIHNMPNIVHLEEMLLKMTHFGWMSHFKPHISKWTIYEQSDV